ncbi:MAG: hypothetical protein ACREA0_27280, partial [bacterium]
MGNGRVGGGEAFAAGRLENLGCLIGVFNGRGSAVVDPGDATANEKGIPKLRWIAQPPPQRDPRIDDLVGALELGDQILLPSPE